MPGALQPAYAGFGAAGQLQQFQQYLGGGGTFDPATSLFVVWLFPNDVFYTSATGQLPGQVPGSPGGANLVENGIANIAAIIQTLAAAGAQHFLVPNMPDLGSTPEFSGDVEASQLSLLTTLFNVNLASTLTLLDQVLAAEIVQFDTASLFAQIQANPGAFGFENVTDSCVANLASGGCNPGNWDKWAFWDGVHPTTAAHMALAAQFRASVPEPASLVLVAIALLSLLWMRLQTRAGDDC